MPARLIFVHGTTVRDVSTSMAEIRKRSQRILGLGDSDIAAAEWGRAVGPPSRDFIKALPPEYKSRAALEDPAAPPREPTEAEIWALLLTDPSLELRLLRDQRTAAQNAAGEDAAGGISFGELPSGDRLKQIVRDLDPPQPQLDEAGFNESDFEDARRELLLDEATIKVMETSTGEDDPDLNDALANSLVARMLRHSRLELWSSKDVPGQDWSSEIAESAGPAAAVDASLRAALVDEVRLGLGSRTRGINLFKKVGGALATRIAVSKRADIMAPLAHFLHDVTFYLANRAAIQRVITESINEAGDNSPVVLLAHSLGGIAAVDLLSRSDAPHVDLLVTVGSQSPLLYLMDALEELKPDNAATRPKVPWLNIYNNDDLLSFCAERVFEDLHGIDDYPIDAKVPFPEAHSAYWRVDDVYKRIKTAMNELDDNE